MLKLVYGTNINVENIDLFTMKDEHSYAAFIGVLSNIYMKAHASSYFRHHPYQASLIISPSMTVPYKKQPESSLVRLQTIISKMLQPSKGINLGIFVGESEVFDNTSKVGLKHTVSQSWPLKNQQSKKDIITVNLPPKQLSKKENEVRYFTLNDIHSSLVKYQIENVDYYTSIKKLFTFLERSRVHISYQGGSAWISVCMNIPTIIVHPQQSLIPFHLKYKLFGQDLGNINVLNKQNKIIHVRTHPCEYHVTINKLKNKILEFI